MLQLVEPVLAHRVEVLDLVHLHFGHRVLLEAHPGRTFLVMLDQGGIEYRFLGERVTVEDQRHFLQRLLACGCVGAGAGAFDGAFDLAVMIEHHRQPAMTPAELLGLGAGFSAIFFTFGRGDGGDEFVEE